MQELPDFASDAKLNYLRRRVGAPYVQWDSKSTWRSLLEELVAKKELDIDIAKDVEIGEDNSLEISGRKVVAYIRDQHAEDPNEPTKYKFHIANCQTIVEARSGRLDGRFVASILESEDNTFLINKIRFGTLLRRGVRERMNVCRNCLKALNFEGYAEAYQRRDQVFREFTIKKFFEHYAEGTSVTIPRRSADEAALNVYSNDFSEIARQIKREAKFSCEELSCDYGAGEGNYSSLHVHHIDGDKSNNSRRNLKVLCIACHAKQPNHGHMRNLV